MGFPPLIEALRDPSRYPHPAAPVTVAETHASWVLLAGGFALLLFGAEFLVRGVGFVKSVEDLEDVVIRQQGGTPLFVRNVARVSLGPEFRRGVLNKAGVEATGGIVLARFGSNPREVIDAVRARLAEIEPGLPARTLPDGSVSRMRVVPYYDRSVIIDETMATLREAVTEELLFAGAVVLLFLLHLRASVSILATLPLSVAIAYIAMQRLGVDANIMSVAGLAIAIGDVADMGIIMTENVYRHLAQRRDEAATRAGFLRVVEQAAHEVAPAILVAVTNTVLSFIPVFALEGQEGKLFQPLAWTKTFAIAGSVILVQVMRAFGLDEVIVGRRIEQRIRGLSLGSAFRYQGRDLRVVGIFESDGGAFERDWRKPHHRFPVHGCGGSDAAAADPGGSVGRRRHVPRRRCIGSWRSPHLVARLEQRPPVGGLPRVHRQLGHLEHLRICRLQPELECAAPGGVDVG